MEEEEEEVEVEEEEEEEEEEVVVVAEEEEEEEEEEVRMMMFDTERGIRFCEAKWCCTNIHTSLCLLLICCHGDCLLLNGYNKSV